MAESSGSLVTNNTNTSKQCSGVQGEENTTDKKTEKVMEPMLLEDYKINEEPRTIKNLIENFKYENITPTINEVMSGLVYILMLESGFIPVGTLDKEECGSFSFKRLLHLSRHLPRNWRRENFCIFPFIMQPYQVHLCQVSCVPAADDLLINCVIRSIKNASFNMILDPLAYIVGCRSNSSGITFQNLKGLSQIFKNTVCFPAKSAIFIEAGERFGCLEHLPEEILLQILLHLKVEDLLNVGLCNKNFKRLTEEPKLWKSLLHSDFSFRSKHKTFIDLSRKYKELYFLSERRLSRSNAAYWL